MRGTITKRGKNSWQVKYDLPRDHGKRRQRYATVTGTYKDAQRELTRLLSSADGGTHVDPTRMTLAEYLCSWLDGAHAQSPKTLERYRELSECQIIPHLGANRSAKAPARTFAAMAQGTDRERAGCSHCDQRAQALAPRPGRCRQERHPRP